MSRYESGHPMPIEQFIHSKDAYRACPTHELPIPWPFSEGTAKNLDRKIYRKIKEECRFILSRYKIKPICILRKLIWSKGSEEDVGVWFIVETEDTNPTYWHKAADEISAVLKTETKNPKHKVEIRNTQRMYANVSSNLPDDEGLLECIKSVEDSVKKLLREKLPKDWTSLAFHMRGPKFNNGPAKPTAVVYVRPGTEARFDSIEEELLGVLKSSKFPNVNLTVEILPGEIVPGQGLAPPKPRAFKGLYNTIPFNTCSISIESPGDKGMSFSVGGWVRLKHKINGKSYAGFLTCYNGITPRYDGSKLDSDVIGIGLDGADESNMPDIRLVWPSVSDVEYTMSEMEKRARQNNLTARNIVCIAALKHLKASGSFGKVIFASGNQVQTQSGAQLDWAFVESSLQENRPHEAPPGRLRLEEGIDYAPNESTRIKNYGTIKSGDWVIRAGRSSGAHGRINYTKRTINWNGDQESTEMEVYGVNSVLSTDFGHEGDAGCWVVNEKFELVGVMIGVDSRGSKNFGIVTPIQDLIKDIEERTGCTVELP